MYYFAGKFVKTLRKRQPVLNITESDVLCVQIAALCYNLGHGPFSHTFADFLKEIKASRRYWKGLRANVMMFQHMIEVNRLPFHEYLDNPEEDIEFIKELMTGKQGPQATLRKDKVFLYEIVVNKMSGLDVNRMDYTMRDAVVLGKRINFKWRKFLNKIRVEICPDGKKHICANEEDLGTYNELFADRHALFKELYFERKNRTVATMINRILSKCGEAEFIKGPDGKWLSLIDAIKTMDTYCCLNEEILEVINETIADPEVEKLIKFLSNSKLLIPIGYVENCQLAGGIQQLKEEIIENEDGLSQDDIIVDVAKSGYERATREYMYYISPSGTVKQWTKEWHAPPADTSAPWRVFYTKHNKELVTTMKRGLRRVIDEKGGEVDTYDNETDVSDLIPEEEPAASQ
ncbi:PREDICTED: deoxynucleoside triphosphate triphosphohydrolase SAMHD1-like [Amphimedon queenslandica]|uniref:HD domain-containing protein n=1 Tax=Amphimedon queenslandica TaxID=400682 RepID=A0AAN0JLY5_AMPQE|nr:PREDICTED: deoxynucleoside triphosphate triphosphohydrolase SAMHD1-like [Amphimedon queenslandica]|eukprot:XP_019857774.1 PREDICTED: deoxynucleoside triphosphate triphosphohydrolase SAMHD1-like [Amphimedon queenslandica]